MIDLDIDRRLEEHLAATAQRMPQAVRDSVFREIPRHRQVGPVSEWTGRLGRLTLAGAAATAVVLVIVAGPALIDRFGRGSGAGPTASPAFEWDAVLNFREFPKQLNPSRDAYGNPAVWGYFHAASDTQDPARYLRFTEFDGTQRDAWVDSRYDGLAVGWPLGSDSLTLQPWGAGPKQGQAAIVAWRAPFDAAVSVTGHVEVDGMCGDGIVFWIRLGSESIERFTLPRGARDVALKLNVVRGETLYFGVDAGSNGDSSCDTTYLRLTITA